MDTDHQKDNLCPLRDMPIGAEGSIVELKATGLARRRLLDLGLVPGTKITAIRRSPFRDPPQPTSQRNHHSPSARRLCPDYRQEE